MMTAPEFWLKLLKRGGLLELEDGRLKYSAPKPMTASVRRYIEDHREELIAELQRREFRPRTTCIKCGAPTTGGYWTCDLHDPFA